MSKRTAPKRTEIEEPINDGHTLELPMQTRDVRLMPETAQPEARTVEVVWSTGAAVRRRDPWTGKRYDEVLSLDPAHVDLSRLGSGAPLLNTHGAFDLDDVIGVVERAWIANSGDAFEGRAVAPRASIRAREAVPFGNRRRVRRDGDGHQGSLVRLP